MTAPKQVTPAQVIRAIRDGKLDKNLASINKEIIARWLSDQKLKQRWRITYDDLVITQDDITLPESVTAEKVAQTSWTQLEPIESAACTLGVIAAALHHRRGLSLVEAVKELGSLTTEAAVEAIDFYDPPTPPARASSSSRKAAAEKTNPGDKR